MPRFQVGDIVDYHSVIGGPVTEPQRVIVAVVSTEGVGDAYWLNDKPGCVAEDALTPPDRSDTDLLRWAVEHAGKSDVQRAPRWSHVANMLGLGSTHAAAICRRFGFDPDEVLGGCGYCGEGQATVCRCNAAEYGFDVGAE